MARPPKKFSIPEEFITKLQEFTKGGFLLTYIDENDQIGCVFNPASEVAAFALPEKTQIICLQLQRQMLDQSLGGDEEA